MHFFGKTIKNARKHTGIKLVIIEKKKETIGYENQVITLESFSQKKCCL